MAEARGERADWEKARDWLNDEKITVKSVKVPCLADIKTEFELYTYLKDGIELCRLIGLVTQGRVLDGIVYRTNNVSTLEEKNIDFFLSHVEKTLNLKRQVVFKDQDVQVFHKFKNFHIVLAGLAKISQKLQIKIHVDKFESKARVTEVNYEEVNTVIYESKEADEVEYFDEIYSNNIKKEKSVTSLSFAIEELIDFNNTFIKKVLENIKTNFKDQETTHLLESQFFPVFELNKLIKLHQNLKKLLHRVEYSYIEIGNTFDTLKDSFLIYCSVTARLKIANEFLADQMTNSVDTKTCIDNLEKGVRRTRPDVQTSCSLSDLMQMIPQHVLRYHIVLDAIVKWASRARKTEVEREARRAYNIMRDMTNHVEQVAVDYKYIKAMEQLKKEIKGLPFFNLHSFGTLQSELKHVLMSNEMEADSFKSFHLLIFSESIVALEEKMREELTGKVSFRGVAMKKFFPEKRFFKRFKIKELDEIRMIKQKYRGRAQTLLWARGYTDMQYNPEKSFVLRFEDADEASTVEDNLKKYINSTKAHVFIGGEHEGHLCEKYRADGHMTNAYVRCDSVGCRKLMKGLLFNAVRCKTCNKVYHTECFSSNKTEMEPDMAEEQFTDPVELNIEKAETLELVDFDLGETDRKGVMLNLRHRRAGTFLLRWSKQRNDYVVAVKNEETSDHLVTQHIIKTVNLDGIKNFYLEKGTCAPTILELVKQHRVSHQLYIPFRIASPAASDDEEDDIADNRDQDDEEYDVPPEDLSEAHNIYFFGDITSQEAKALLKGKPAGSFLIRKNNNQWKQSWINFSGTCQHAHIAQTNGKFSLQQKKFTSIHELMMFYQKQESVHRLALRDPVNNPEFEQAEAENKTDEDMQLERAESRRKEPGNISSYQGPMSQKEAENILQREVDSTYMLRKSDDDVYYISYKISRMMKHIKVKDDGENYNVELDNGKTVTKTSLRRLIDELKVMKVFTSSPLCSTQVSVESALRESASSSHEAESLQETYVLGSEPTWSQGQEEVLSPLPTRWLVRESASSNQDAFVLGSEPSFDLNWRQSQEEVWFPQSTRQSVRENLSSNKDAESCPDTFLLGSEPSFEITSSPLQEQFVLPLLPRGPKKESANLNQGAASVPDTFELGTEPSFSFNQTHVQAKLSRPLLARPTVPPRPRRNCPIPNVSETSPGVEAMEVLASLSISETVDDDQDQIFRNSSVGLDRIANELTMSLRSLQERQPTPPCQRSRQFPPIGQMMKSQADILLNNKALNSWILRLDSQGEEGISVKKRDRVVHIKLYHNMHGSSLKAADPHIPLDDLIKRLIHQGILGQQVTAGD